MYLFCLDRFGRVSLRNQEQFKLTRFGKVVAGVPLPIISATKGETRSTIGMQCVRMVFDGGFAESHSPLRR
jgi:hypothetical protein